MLLTFDKWKIQQTNFIFLAFQAHHGKSIFSITQRSIYQNTPCWRSEATSRWSKSENSKFSFHTCLIFCDRFFFVLIYSTKYTPFTLQQNGGQNLSTSKGIFLLLDVIFWVVFTCLTVYVYCNMPFPAASPFMYIPWCMPGYIPTGIYITLCWFSLLFETLATKKKHMIAVCVLIAILFSLSVFISLVLSTTTRIDFWQNNNLMFVLCLAFFASIWNFVRFAFQINLIRWIQSTNGHSIHTEETDYIPLLPKTLNGYQSI